MMAQSGRKKQAPKQTILPKVQDPKIDREVEEEFKNFWVPILFDTETGRLNLDQLKKELFDYSTLIKNVPKVYGEVTGGRVSKPLTDPDAVIAEFEDYLNTVVNDAVEESKRCQD